MRDPRPQGLGSTGVQPLINQLDLIKQDVSQLASFSGADYVRAVERIDSLIAGLPDQVGAIADEYITANSYTKSQIDSKVSSPGDVTPNHIDATGHINAAGDIKGADLITTGDVTAAGVVKAPGSRAYIVSTSYAGAWLNGDGTLGISPSSRRFKTDIVDWEPDIAKLRQLRAVMFRYNFAGMETSPLQLGFIAEELEELGFTEFSFYDDSGQVEGLNYDRIVVGLLKLSQHDDARITAIEAKLATL